MVAHDTALGWAIVREHSLRKRAYRKHTARELANRLAPYTHYPPNTGHSVRVADAVAPAEPDTVAGVAAFVILAG